MSAELVALATSAGTALATAAATDVWGKVRSGFSRFFKRRSPELRSQDEGLLDAMAELVSEAEPAEVDVIRRSQAAMWRKRLASMMESDPAAVAELRALLDEIEPQVPVAQQVHLSHTGVATASGGGFANTGYIGGNVR